MPRSVTGVDVNASAAVLLRGSVKGNTFAVTDYAYQALDVADTTAAWDAAEASFSPKDARVGVTGRDVNVRYVRVPRLPDWQLKKLMRFEVEEVGGAAENAVAADFNVLPEIPEVEGEDIVLLAMARESLLEIQHEALGALGGTLDAFTPNSIALYNAWLRFGVVLDDTVLVANIGAHDVDVIVVRGTDLLFARNLTGGARMIEQSIADRLGIDLARAAKVRRQLVDLTPGATYSDQNAERASRAASAPAGQIASLLQTAVSFAKSQIRLQTLRLDRVLVCGDGAHVRGIEQYLASVMGTKVEVFDPFTVVDTSKLDAEDAALLEKHRSASVVALGLATAGSDPDAYGIDILPAAVHKKREFTRGTLFLILAAVLAVGFLGLRYTTFSTEAEQAATRATTLNGQVRRLERDDAAAEALLVRNAELAELGRELRSVAGAGRQLDAVLTALDGLLPRGFSITRLTNQVTTEEELGITKAAPAPVLFIEGEAEEGVEPNNVVYQRFVEELKAALPGYEVLASMGSMFRTFELTVTAFADLPDPEVTESDEEIGG
jgi:Tfp pilus assembly PilM family ATPase/outer membrane murein-binding lipoprotein Lpp